MIVIQRSSFLYNDPLCTIVQEITFAHILILLQTVFTYNVVCYHQCSASLVLQGVSAYTLHLYCLSAATPFVSFKDRNNCTYICTDEALEMYIEAVKGELKL